MLSIAVLVVGVTWFLLILPFVVRAWRETAVSPPAPAYRERGFWGTFLRDGRSSGFGALAVLVALGLAAAEGMGRSVSDNQHPPISES